MKGILISTRHDRVFADFQILDSAVMKYQVSAGVYPSTQQGLDALVNQPSTAPIPKRWNQIMKEIPNDPWGNPYGYKYPGSVSKSEYEIISMGPDGMEGTEDDISSQKDQ